MAIKTEGLEFDLKVKDYSKRAFSSANDNMRRLKRNADGANRSLDRMRGGLRSLSTSLAGIGISVTAAAVALGALLRASVQNTDMLAKTAKRLGITTQALVELKFAAEQSGVGFEKMQMAMQRMSRRAAEAAVGMGEARGALKELGLNAKEFSSKPMEQQLDDLAGAFEGVTGHSQKLRLAFKLFDSEGVAMLNVLNQGSAGIRRMRNELQLLGGSVTKEGVQAAEELTDAWNRFTTAIGGAARKMVTALEPAISKTLNSAARAVANFTAKTDLEKAARDYDLALGRLDKAQRRRERLGLTSGADRIKKLQANVKKSYAQLTRLQADFNKKQKAASEKAFAIDPANIIVPPKKAKKKKKTGLSKAERERLRLLRRAQALRERFFTTEEKIKKSVQEINLFKTRGIFTEAEAVKYVRLKKDEIIKSSKAYGEAQSFLERHLTAEQQIEQVRGRVNKLLDQGFLKKAQAERILQQEIKLIHEGTEAYREQQKAQEDAKKIIEDVRGPTEKYNLELNRLKKHLHEGRLEQRHFNLALKSAQKEFRETSLETAGVLDKAFAGLGKNIEDSLVDAISGAEGRFKSFKSFANSLLRDVSKSITRTALRGLGVTGEGGLLQNLFSPVKFGAGGGITKSSFGGAGGFFKGIGGFLGSLLGRGGATAGAGGGGGGFFTSAVGLARAGASLFAGGFERGGVLPAGGFGLVGEAGPELIASGKKPSTIYPKKSLGGGDVFNITMNIQAADAESFRRSEAQILSGLGVQIQRAVGRNR